MVPALSHEALQQAQLQVPCRQHQLQHLAIYYNHYLPSPPLLVTHGLEQSGKLEAIVALLQASNLKHAIVKSRECLAQRHLLTKIFAVCIRQLGQTESMDKYERIDSLNSLLVNMQKLFEGRNEKFVLVIDGVDKQRGASYTLLPALAQLGDMIQDLSLILTTSSSRSIALHRSGTPYIHFPLYTRVEAITMTTKQSASIPSELPEHFPSIPEPQMNNIYKSFVTTVYDTLTTHTSSTSHRTFQRTCEKLWPRFIWPMLSGEAPPQRNVYKHSSSKWDFARLLGRNRSLFQRDGEKALLSHLTSDPTEVWTFEQLLAKYEDGQRSPQPIEQASEPKQKTPLLKSFSTLLLISSYLASHTPLKHDIILFSRLSSSSTNKRRYLSSSLSKSRMGGVRKTPTKRKSDALDGMTGNETPSKKRKMGDETTEGLAGEKTPKSTRLLLEKTSNIPRPFTLERVIAILRAIHQDGLPRTKGAADKVYAELAELERLRLVVRCAGGLGDSGTRGGDDGILEEKWRINVGRDFVIGTGQYWGMGLEGWEID